MGFYPRGNWIVGSPIWALKDLDINDRIKMMLCPHPQWVEVGRDKELISEIECLVINEKCPICGATRGRAIPMELSAEPFDPSTPTSGPWYERLYNLGNFVLLSRRYQEHSRAPITFMTRVETQAGNVNATSTAIDTPFFSPAALEHIADMETMIKLGPKRYVSFRILKDGRKTKEEKDDVKEHADSLVKVVQDVGRESIAAARTIFEAETDHEIQEQEELQIQEMEREVAERKAQIEERMKRGPKSK